MLRSDGRKNSFGCAVVRLSHSGFAVLMSMLIRGWFDLPRGCTVGPFTGVYGWTFHGGIKEVCRVQGNASELLRSDNAPDYLELTAPHGPAIRGRAILLPGEPRAFQQRDVGFLRDWYCLLVSHSQADVANLHPLVPLGEILHRRP